MAMKVVYTKVEELQSKLSKLYAGDHSK